METFYIHKKTSDITYQFVDQIKDQAECAGQLSSEHFSVDFKGEKRSRDTHESKTDPDFYLYWKNKGSASKLSYLGHIMMENCNGLVVGAQIAHARGTEEREAALKMVGALNGTHQFTLDADKNYDVESFVDDCCLLKAAPHVAQNNSNHSSAIDGRTSSDHGYNVSQTIRMRIEERFGWATTVGGIRKSRFVGKEKLNSQFVHTFAAYNLVLMRNLGVSSC